VAGASIQFEYDNQAVLARIRQIATTLGTPEPLLRDFGEVLLESTEQRFSTQQSPDGVPWQALSPRYQMRKHLNADKILTLRGYLGGGMRYQVSGDTLAVGTNSKYGAIHQFGGEIHIAARSQQVYFKQDKSGEVGRLFVKKAKSNFAQWVTIGAYTIKIPARSFLGVSQADEAAMLAKAAERLENGA
jgi:phage virion morphogenesis protein